MYIKFGLRKGIRLIPKSGLLKRCAGRPFCWSKKGDFFQGGSHSCDEAAFKSMETASALREIISDEVVWTGESLEENKLVRKQTSGLEMDACSIMSNITRLINRPPGTWGPIKMVTKTLCSYENISFRQILFGNLGTFINTVRLVDTSIKTIKMSGSFQRSVSD